MIGRRSVFLRFGDWAGFVFLSLSLSFIWFRLIGYIFVGSVILLVPFPSDHRRGSLGSRTKKKAPTCRPAEKNGTMPSCRHPDQVAGLWMWGGLARITSNNIFVRGAAFRGGRGGSSGELRASGACRRARIALNELSHQTGESNSCHPFRRTTTNPLYRSRASLHSHDIRPADAVSVHSTATPPWRARSTCAPASRHGF